MLAARRCLRVDSKRVLVTGISGFVGPILAKRLLDLGYEVYGLHRKRANARVPERLVELGIDDKVVLVEGDLTDMGSLLQALRTVEPEIIFHLGAQSFVPRSFRNPIETYQINTMGTIYLLEAARLLDLDTRFLFAGSSEEYGLQFIDEKHYNRLLEKYGVIFPEPTRIPELPIDEYNPLRPMSPYAVSKVHGDYATRNYYYSYGMKTLVTRAFNHEGPGRGPQFVTSTIVRQLVQVHLGERDHMVIGNVNTFRDWSHVNDIIEGYIKLAETGEPGNVYVLGSGRTNSVLTYILLTLSELGWEPTRLETIDGTVKIDDPASKCDKRYFNMDFEKTKIDCLLLDGEIEFTLQHKGLVIHTTKEPIKVIFDKSRFRPSEVPILLSNPERAKSKGFTIRHRLRDIIKDQILYYLDPARRKIREIE